MSRHSLALGLWILAVGVSTGCGGGDDAATSSRLARQDMTDGSGTLIQRWTYAYDGIGYVSEVRGFDSSGTHVTTATFGYEDGRRSGAVTRNPSGTVLSSMEYTYVDGAPSGYILRTGDGSVFSTGTYLFQDGRKVRTTRYDPTSAVTGWTDFAYDPVTGLRTVATSHDANGGVIGTSTRTYRAGLLQQVTQVAGSNTTYRTFLYEDGRNVTDPEPFFEF